ERRASFESIKKYPQATYYGGEWKPHYDRWVKMLAGMYAGDGGRLVAWNQALTSDMILSQPGVPELERISVPTVLMIGEQDTTAIGKDRAPPEVAKTLGNYRELGRMAHQRIKDSVLVPFAELGHSPQVQDPARFNAALLEHLGRRGWAWNRRPCATFSSQATRGTAAKSFAHLSPREETASRLKLAERRGPPRRSFLIGTRRPPLRVLKLKLSAR